MNYKEEARKIVLKFASLNIGICHYDLDGDLAIATGSMTMKDAKQCALIAVDEIIADLDSLQNIAIQQIEIRKWQRIKQEIENYE